MTIYASWREQYRHSENNRLCTWFPFLFAFPVYLFIFLHIVSPFFFSPFFSTFDYNIEKTQVSFFIILFSIRSSYPVDINWVEFQLWLGRVKGSGLTREWKKERNGSTVVQGCKLEVHIFIFHSVTGERKTEMIEVHNEVRYLFFFYLFFYPCFNISIHIILLNGMAARK